LIVHSLKSVMYFVVAMMAALDDTVKAIVTTMYAEGLMSNSLIVFTNDVSYYALLAMTHTTRASST